MTLSLESIPVYDLDIFTSPCNVHRDLHIYVQYVQERTVKRATRSNRLSKSDARRLARLMSDPEAVQEVKTEGG